MLVMEAVEDASASVRRGSGCAALPLLLGLDHGDVRRGSGSTALLLLGLDHGEVLCGNGSAALLLLGQEGGEARSALGSGRGSVCIALLLGLEGGVARRSNLSGLCSRPGREAGQEYVGGRAKIRG